jgi:MFS family permease
LTKKPINKINVVGFSLAGWIFDFYDLILYAFLLAFIKSDFNLTDIEVGLVFSFSLAITALGGIVLGYLGDKYGRKPAIISSVFIFSFGTFLSAFAWDLFSLLLFRLITGFGIGGEWAAGHTLVNETLNKRERGRASAIIQSGAPIGAGIASIFGGFVTPVVGWQSSFILASAPSFVLVVLMIKYLPESPRFLIFKNESFSITDLKGTSYVRKATKRSTEYLWQVRKTLVLTTILSSFGMLSYWILFSWTPKYLKVDLGYSDANVGIWMLLANIGAFIGYLSFGFVLDFTKKIKGTFILYTLIFGISTLIFTNGLANGSTNTILVGILFTGFGTGFWSGFGPLYSKIFPTRIRNTCSSFSFNIGRLTAFIAPLIVPIAASLWGISGAISIAAFFGIALGFWILLIPVKEEDEPIEHEIIITRVPFIPMKTK